MCAATCVPDHHTLYMPSERVRQLIVNSCKFSFFLIIFNLKTMENVYFDELGCYFLKVSRRMMRQHSEDYEMH